MLHLNFAAIILFCALLVCLEGTQINQLPELNFDTVAKAYQDGKNRLIIVHVDGLLPSNAEAEKKQLEGSLSRLAKDAKNEICLISNKDVDTVRAEYSDTEGVRIIGNNGKHILHAKSGKGILAQKLPMDEIEAIKARIIEDIGRHGFKYKVKLGVNPMVIDDISEDWENNLNPLAQLLYHGSWLQTVKPNRKAVKQWLLNPLGIMIDFEHGNEVVYPIDGLKEGTSGVFEGVGGTLTPLARDFGLSVGNEAAEFLHEAMGEANFYSATVITPDNKQSTANSRLANIEKVNEILEKLAQMADK